MERTVDEGQEAQKEEEMIAKFPSVVVACLVVMADVSDLSAQLRPVEKVPSPAAAPSRPLIDATVGSFDLSNSKGPNSCRLMLLGEAKGDQFAMTVPYGCRKAFPALIRVELWAPLPNGGIRLATAQGQPVLDFTQKDSRLTTDARSDIVFEMKPVDADWFQRRVAAQSAKPPSTVTAPPPQGRADAIAHPEGRYAVLRAAEKPSACELTLNKQPMPPKGRIPEGVMKAGYIAGCQDRGMQIFDPVAWRIDKEQLVLYARKGHDLTLVHDGKVWRKAVASGEPLQLQKN